MPSGDARDAFNTFMHTALAPRLTAARTTDALAERHAVEDLWRDPLVNKRWQRLALRLTAADCDRIGRVASERGLAGSGLQWLAAESATEGWALGSAGHVEPVIGSAALRLRPAHPVRTTPDAVAPMPSARLREGRPRAPAASV